MKWDVDVLEASSAAVSLDSPDDILSNIQCLYPEARSVRQSPDHHHDPSLTHTHFSHLLNLDDTLTLLWLKANQNSVDFN